MIPLAKIFNSFFAEKLPAATQVQTALEPVHEGNANEGCEFLDIVPFDEPAEDEKEL